MTELSSEERRKVWGITRADGTVRVPKSTLTNTTGAPLQMTNDGLALAVLLGTQAEAQVEMANALWAIAKQLGVGVEVITDPQIADALGKMEQSVLRIADKG